MTPSSFTRTGRLLAALSILAIAFMPLVGTAAADHCHEDCRSSWAQFGDYSTSGVTLVTQAGTHTIELPRGTAERIALSTTGEVQVPVEYQCIEVYHVYVVKEGGEDGTGIGLGGGVIYDEWRYPACGSGVDVHDVPIGLDAGTYRFFLEWWGCTGEKGQDYREIVVFDPPLPLPHVSP